MRLRSFALLHRLYGSCWTSIHTRAARATKALFFVENDGRILSHRYGFNGAKGDAGAAVDAFFAINLDELGKRYGYASFAERPDDFGQFFVWNFGKDFAAFAVDVCRDDYYG